MLKAYQDQIRSWPSSGKHILAKFDEEKISVYQAYNSVIAEFAVANQRFGGEFSFERMSWIKPNFLWMMFRSGWASKDGQERILEIQISRAFFDLILENAVSSSFNQENFATKEEWKREIAKSDVRIQWDPDHDPFGKPLERRAVQLGLRGKMLEDYGKSQVIKIIDITEFVKDQKSILEATEESLILPEERVYIPRSKSACDNAGLS